METSQNPLYIYVQQETPCGKLLRFSLIFMDIGAVISVCVTL